MIVPMIGIGQCLSGDCKNGYGVFTNSVGTYVGEFENGRYHGQGTLVTTGVMAGSYCGEWKNGTRDGMATEHMLGISGDWLITYIGHYKYNKRNGKGLWLQKDGTRKEGLWRNGEFSN